MATRFYLPSSGAAAVSVTPSTDWEDTSFASAALRCVTAASATAMATRTADDNNASNRDLLLQQYVSDRIGAQTISAQTLEFQIRASETSNNNNLFTAIGVRVVSEDGTTVRGTLLAVTRNATEMATSLTNRRITATTTEVVAQNGDRIVIEIGGGGDPAGSDDHDFSLRVGDNGGSDLPEDDSDTNDYNPWVEFPNTLSAYVDYPTVTDVETDEDVTQGDTGVTVTGTNFEASQGAGTVEISDNATYASGTKVTQTVTSWGATAIDITVVLGSLTPGALYLWVTNNSAARNITGMAITVHRKAFVLSASSHIGASGAATTAQLDPPAGKTTGDFGGGRIQDDENPADTVDLATDDYGEWEWCLVPVAAHVSNGQQYQFRVLVGGAAPTISVTPAWTLGEVTGIRPPRLSINQAVKRAATW